MGPVQWLLVFVRWHWLSRRAARYRSQFFTLVFLSCPGFLALKWPRCVGADVYETLACVPAAADFGLTKPSIFHAVLAATDSP